MRVTIVGGGIAGLSSAWALTKRGHRVTLMEQGPIPNPLAASGDHHRIIRRAYGAADGYARLISEAFEAWDEMWLDLGVRHLAPVGFLCVTQRPGDAGDVFVEGLARGGYVHEILPARQAAERWPFLDAAAIERATFSPEGGSLGCRLIARDLARWLRDKGASLRENTRVVAVRPESGAVQCADGDVVEADRIIVCAGAWTLRLVPAMTASLHIQRTAVAYVAPPVDLAGAWAQAPVILEAGGDSGGYVLPPAWGAGLKLGTDWHRRPADDPDADRSPAPGEAEAILRRFSPPFARIEDYMPLDVVTCCYTFTADERFTAQRFDRLLAVSACSGHGYKFGAAVGRRVADAVESDDDATLVGWLRAEPAAA